MICIPPENNNLMNFLHYTTVIIIMQAKNEKVIKTAMK